MTQRSSNLLRWSEADLAEAADLVAVYKDIRPVVQRGRLYRVASVLDRPLGASQYVAADGARVVVLSWWGPHQGGVRPPRLRLAGLEPGARYLESGTGLEHLGAALMQDGLKLPDGAGSDYGSTLIQFNRLP